MVNVSLPTLILILFALQVHCQEKPSFTGLRNSRTSSILCLSNTGFTDPDLGRFTNIGQTEKYCNKECNRNIACCAPRTPSELQVKFRHYVKGKSERILNWRDPSDAKFLIGKSSKVVFIIDGWMEKFNNNSWTLLVKDTFIKLEGETNVIIVDYGDSQTIRYWQSVQDIRVVGAMIGKGIVNWKIAERSLLVGLSLGGQIIGEAGRYAQLYSEEATGKVSKIKECHSLDPAGPGFDGCDVRLTKDDCEVVQVIHTNARQRPVRLGDISLGTAFKSGHCDYWINCGFEQGCEGRSCSHVHSVKVYYSSINHLCDYKAIPCPECGKKREDCLSKTFFKGTDFLKACRHDMDSNYYVASNATKSPYCP